MSIFTKTEIVIVCERCGVGRMFNSDNVDKIHEVATQQLGWKVKEDEFEQQVKHYCPNCKGKIKEDDKNNPVSGLNVENLKNGDESSSRKEETKEIEVEGKEELVSEGEEDG